MAFVSLVAVVAFTAKIIHGRRHTCTLRLATGGRGGEYYTFGEALKSIIEAHQHEVGGQPRIQIELVTETEGSQDNMELLERRDVDLALAQNDTPARASVQSIALLFPEVLHLYVRSDADVDSIAGLKDKRIATLPERSGTCCFLKQLLRHYRVVRDESFGQLLCLSPEEAHGAFRRREADAVFHTIALGETAKQYIGQSLEQGGKLLPIGQVAALRSLHPFLERATIPKGFYVGHPPLPERDIPTAAVRAVLLVHSEVDRSIVYRITRILYEYRNEIVTANPLAAEIRAPEKPDQILFPLHAGALAYYSREKPGFLITYAEPLALGLSLSALCASAIWHLRIRLEQRRKRRADMYNLEILGLVKRIRGTENLQDLQVIRRKLFDIFGRVLEDLDEERISTESFQLFTFPWDVAIGAIRHRELTLTSQSPIDDRAAEDCEDVAGA
jgi:TRAP transporter TAXI family solute receptor